MHKQREKVDAALVSGDSYRDIAARFSITPSALVRHKADHLADSLIKAKAAQEMANATDVMGELMVCSRRLNLLYDACDRWLRDPADPSRYDIGPRAEDVEITYFQKGANGKPVKRKTRLSELLKRVKISIDNGLEFEMVETKHTDPRELLLKTFDRLKAHLELLAELQGKLPRNPQINVLLASSEWLRLRTTILVALEAYPDARIAVAKAIGDGHVGE